ncbi:MAG TPA: FUSC family protein [Solirubrobacteraceae bacterium]|nr:FUSC family protein [Solirubrobacteraceae bacterium]
MSDAAHGLPLPRLNTSGMAASAASWLPVWSPAAALRAVRATIVVAGLFAFTDQVIGNLQMATFAAFGGFATLVLASFNGTRREKLRAHAALAVAGSILLTIGTAVNSSTVLAALVTVPVTFTVFFAGIAGPNAASGVTGALLVYVLPAASPGTISMVPDRLAGWWLASCAGTLMVLLLSPGRSGDQLRGASSRLARTLADELDATLGGAAVDDHLAATIAAKHELLAQFTATPSRPIGLGTADQALANAVELLEWCTTLLSDAVRERADLREASPADRELLAATAAVLRSVSMLFAGSGSSPDLERLERRRAESLSRLGELPSEQEDYAEAARVSFHAHTISVAVLALAADALVASGRSGPEQAATDRWRWYLGGSAPAAPRSRVASAAAVTRRGASVRSVWFVNSLRGSVALAVAVAIADLSSVQHGFWVVLGALSVLRTNAASTGATAIRALAGTAIGFVIGGALLVAIGSDSTALWVALPVAVFVAAYTPGTAPFAIGQAAFTVTIAVLFNLLAPVGWKVGVLRIEDVALGCSVSVVVGLLFWPRGVSSVVGNDLAEAYRSGARYLTQAVDWARGTRAAEPDGAVEAIVAGQRLEDALRGYLAEQGSKRIGRQELWRLVGGSMRLRLTAHSVAGLPPDGVGVGQAASALEHRTSTLAGWYERLAELVDRPHGRSYATLQAPTFGPADVVQAGANSHYGIWLCENLDHLAENLDELVEPATRVAEMRRRPWWR